MISNFAYIGIMALVSLLIRTLPLTVIRRQIKNRFLKSFLYYVPYVTLAVMTVPAMIDATKSPFAGAAALVSGIILAWLGADLLKVSVACCVIVFVMELFV